MLFRNLFDSLKPGHSRTPVQQALRGAARRRPPPCRLAVEALEGRCVPASLSVSDVTIIEGNAGTQNAVVTVRLDAPSAQTVTVNYNTADGTATAGSDYNAVFGKLTFARGETSKSILVPVRGDRLAEPNETFFVNLSGANNAKIAHGQGVVTIVDDEPRISISDAYVENGPYFRPMTFTVRLSAAYDQAVTVNFATQDQSAIAGWDYLATSGTLTFAPGETTKTITVQLTGNPSNFNVSFAVNLSGTSSNALIINGQGIGNLLGPYGAPPEPYDGTNTY